MPPGTEVLRGALEFLLPPACLACGAGLPLPRPAAAGAMRLLCEDCLAFLKGIRLDRACPTCGMPRPRPPRIPAQGAIRCAECESLPPSFQRARAAFPYFSPAAQMVRNMKYRRAAYLAEPLVELAMHVAGPWLRSHTPETLVVAVPMYTWRHVRRGYNQAHEIAAILARELGWQLLDVDAFVRRKPTAPQARFHSRSARLENLSNVFAVRKPGLIGGRHILLVDDVMTTGATVASAAQALQEAGAAEIDIFTLLRARFGEDQDDAARA